MDENPAMIFHDTGVLVGVKHSNPQSIERAISTQFDYYILLVFLWGLLYYVLFLFGINDDRR